MVCQPATILNVDDDDFARRAVSDILRSAGFQVEEAATGNQTLQMVRHQPDLVLLDVYLGDMDGRDVCRQIKEEFSPAVLVLLVSGVYLDAQDRVHGLEEGADGYLTKPINPDELVAQVSALLRMRRAEESARQAQADADEARARLAALVETSDDAIIAETGDGIIATWNSGAERMYGYAADEVIGRPLSLLVPPERTAELTDILERVRRGQRVPSLDTVHLRKGGQRLEVFLTVSRIRDSAGNLVGTSIIGRDVTALRRAERSARASEVRKAAILEAVLDALITVDCEGHVLECNPAAQAMFGYGQGAVLGKPLADLIIAPSLRGRHDNSMAQQLAAGDEGVLGRRMEMMAVRADGKEFPVELTATRVRLEDEVLVTTNIRDLSEHKRLEQQYLQAQKMDAVGRLAGGIAHDFNNLLTVILGFTELVRAQLPERGNTRRHLDEIWKAGDRAATLTRQLLTFSRKQVIEPRVLALNEVIAGMEKMLRRTIGEDLDLAIALEPALGTVKADPGQVEQILMNLVVNARDAMPQGGKLTIETHNVDLDETYARSHGTVLAGRYVMLSVSDNGCGMDKATQTQIFEPFFTTKEVGKGTGLGLATVYGIVKQSGGSIEVYSEIGVGSTFKVYFPRLDETKSAQPSTGGRSPLPCGKETVLLAEDESAVRALISSVLQGCGYKVLEANSGADALRLAAESQGTIHLLVTDVVMPELGGRQLAERLERTRPEMKSLYLSGYTDDAMVRHGILSQEVHFLQKPFSSDALARKVRAVLDE